MSSILNSFASLTIYSFSVCIIVWIVSRSLFAVFKSEEKSEQNFSNGGFDTQEVRRDMGFYECYLAKTNRKYGTRIYAILSLKSLVNLRRENIKNTLRLLARKYPILRARIASYHIEHAYKTEFIINAEDRFVPELRFVNTSNWKMVLEEALLANSERSGKQLLWNTIVLREQYEASEKVYINTILFLFDPVIVDRISVVKFTEDFISTLCQLVNCDIHVNNMRTVHLEAPTEEFLRLPFLLLLFSQIKQVWIKIFSFAQGPVSNCQKERRCRVRTKPFVVTKCISEKDTYRLFKYCHHLNCSLTALFITAWSEIMSCRTGSAKALCHRKPVTVVVDYRTSLSTVLPRSYLSNVSSCYQLQLLCNQENKSRHFESTARYCENLLNVAVKKKKHLDLMWKLKYHNQSLSTKEHCVQSPLEISDVGRFDFKPTWPFLLHEIFIGASNTSTVNLTLLVVNNKLYCGMHLSSHFSGCADLLNALLARVVQNMSLNIL